MKWQSSPNARAHFTSTRHVPTRFADKKPPSELHALLLLLVGLTSPSQEHFPSMTTTATMPSLVGAHPSKTENCDAVDLILQDHRLCDSLFNEIPTITDANFKKTRFALLREELSKHTAVEEQVRLVISPICALYHCRLSRSSLCSCCVRSRLASFARIPVLSIYLSLMCHSFSTPSFAAWATRTPHTPEIISRTRASRSTRRRKSCSQGSSRWT